MGMGAGVGVASGMLRIVVTTAVHFHASEDSDRALCGVPVVGGKQVLLLRYSAADAQLLA